jgi:hypothetical protein
MIKDFLYKMKDFGVAKMLRRIYNQKNGNRDYNMILEFKDDEHGIVRARLPIPYPKIMDVRRITFFVEAVDKSKPFHYLPKAEEVEIEFVRCSDD